MYLMIIYLELLSPAISIDLPKSTTGSRMALCLVFLRMGFTLPLLLPERAVVSYTHLFTLI